MTERKPFLTGSRVYGKPHAHSDTDLVVLVDVETRRALMDAGVVDEGKGEDYEEPWIPHARFGKLDLILCDDPDLFDVWKAATEFLKTKAPVERSKAIEYMNKKRKRFWESQRGVSEPTREKKPEEKPKTTKSPLADGPRYRNTKATAPSEWDEPQAAPGSESWYSGIPEDEIPF